MTAHELQELRDKAKDLRVLYVEDEQLIRKIMGKILSKIFQTVEMAENGEQGLLFYKESYNQLRPYDIVISDISMPIMNGLEMIQLIKNINPAQYTIIISAHGDSEYLLEAINHGADSFLVKPVDASQLAICLKKVVNQLQREQQLQRIQKLYCDELTKLPTRLKMVSEEKIPNHDFLLVNIDDFHKINDVYGYEFGDFILSEMANRLQQVARQNNGNVYRIHTDHFVLTIPMAEEESHTFKNSILQKINTIQIASQKKPFQFMGQSAFVIVTIAVVQDNDYTSMEAAEKKASSVLRDAKNQKKSYLIYEERKSTSSSNKERMMIHETILAAIENNHFHVYLQPIQNNKTGMITKHECLIRMIDETGYIYQPGQFLAIAEMNKTYPQISAIILTEILMILNIYKTPVSMNLAVSDLANEDMVNTIDSIFTSYHELAQYITFEILESDGVNNYQQVNDFIKLVKKHGAKIAIDDFGIGYSNYKHIAELDVNYLKIDGSLIRDLPENKKSVAIVESIQLFCQRLGIETVAEYVHSEQVYQAVQELGINFSQGYWIGKPLPISKYLTRG